MTFHVLALALLVAGLMPNTARPQILPEEWTTYQERFVAEDGRVVDDGNGGISHSEGQGYGLLLAVLAGDRPGFERIWSFTQRELMLRDDGLAAWKWDPATTPHIMDANNASDGDILIAYALAQADALWSEDGFGESARQIAQALARTSVFEHHGEMLLRPGVAGFAAGERPDGPVVNPWLSMAAKPVPAEGFPAEFGYNALRIPLYLMRAHDPDMELLKRMRDGMTGPSGGVARVDLDAGRVIEELTDPGYRIIPALASCILDRQPLADDLTRFTPTNYYPSTLHLLSLSFARKERPECL